MPNHHPFVLSEVEGPFLSEVEGPVLSEVEGRTRSSTETPFDYGAGGPKLSHGLAQVHCLVGAIHHAFGRILGADHPDPDRHAERERVAVMLEIA